MYIKYFEEISKIPRMSGKEEKIADYVEEFAKKRNLKYKRDQYGNLIVVKESVINKDKESVILQCHLDMVCEKENNISHDFEKDGLEIYVENDCIKANGTTLGADNGIGIAIILEILNSNEIQYPRIEAIFTVQEETTMLGAKVIDTSSLLAKKMICLDNMNQEELVIGCAGAKIFEYEIKGNTINNISDDFCSVRISMTGFKGGHSGKDISEKRGNPIKEMGYLLKNIDNNYELYIKNINGGRKVNVIPRECYCDIYIKKDEIEKIGREIEALKKH